MSKANLLGVVLLREVVGNVGDMDVAHHKMNMLVQNGKDIRFCLGLERSPLLFIPLAVEGEVVLDDVRYQTHVFVNVVLPKGKKKVRRRERKITIRGETAAVCSKATIYKLALAATVTDYGSQPTNYYTVDSFTAEKENSYTNPTLLPLFTFPQSSNNTMNWIKMKATEIRDRYNFEGSQRNVAAVYLNNFPLLWRGSQKSSGLDCLIVQVNKALSSFGIDPFGLFEYLCTSTTMNETFLAKDVFRLSHSPINAATGVPTKLSTDEVVQLSTLELSSTQPPSSLQRVVDQSFGSTNFK
ncbi:hypothetical protein EDB82DRAFT_479523 [Fusarium venenatum]|uniref:uncharacterized protein n=1 Tax=Fusarium venenatum TaxID=56646 RepID=UPI001DC7AD83|nr:hypothetical protein EDB82DRAFT_479523 [Fusarium venenatum]